MKLVKLGDITTQIRGVSYKKEKTSNIQIDNYIPILRANNIDDNGINKKELVYVSQEFVSKKQILKYGDILIAASSGSKHIVGKAAMIEDNSLISFGAFCKVLRPTISVNKEYLKYFFKTPNYRRTISRLSEGVNINNLKTEHFNSLYIPLPPLETQQKIAAILDQADALRQNDRQILEHYDRLAQSVFLEMFGDPVTNPKGWDLQPFGYFAKFDTRMTSDFSAYANYPHIGIANIEKDTGILVNYKLVKEENLVSGKYTFTSDHIIYSKIRPNLNKVALPDFPGLCSADSYPLLVNKSHTNRIFFAFLLRSEAFIDFILKHATRTNIPKANKDQMKKFNGIAPPVELQNRFAEIIRQIEQQKQITRQSLQKSEELFQSLLQRAFRGELS